MKWIECFREKVYVVNLLVFLWVNWLFFEEGVSFCFGWENDVVCYL